jgi:hypothetical protein
MKRQVDNTYAPPSLGSKKILVGMVEIAGQYRNLSCGIAAIGVSHDYITYSDNSFGYGGVTK